eukprot:3325945-Rhodomonas_salina.1
MHVTNPSPKRKKKKGDATCSSEDSGGRDALSLLLPAAAHCLVLGPGERDDAVVVELDSGLGLEELTLQGRDRFGVGSDLPLQIQRL